MPTAMVMPAYVVATSQQPYSQPPNQANRYRKGKSYFLVFLFLRKEEILELCLVMATNHRIIVVA